MDPTFVTDDEPPKPLASSLSKKSSASTSDKGYESVFANEDSPRSASAELGFDGRRSAAHSALEEEIFAKAANQVVERDKRTLPFESSSLSEEFQAKRAQNDFPTFSMDTKNHLGSSAVGEDLNFNDVFDGQAAGSDMQTRGLAEAPSIGSADDEVVRPRLRKHTSFEEEERMDMDALLANASMETVKRSDAFIEALHEVHDGGVTPDDVNRLLVLERMGSTATDDPVPSTPKTPMGLAPLPVPSQEVPPMQLITPPKVAELRQEVITKRPDTDNASDFDLEAVLAGRNSPEHKAGKQPGGFQSMVENPVEIDTSTPEVPANVPSTSLSSVSPVEVAQSVPIVRGPSEFDLQTAFQASPSEIKAAMTPRAPEEQQQAILVHREGSDFDVHTALRETPGEILAAMTPRATTNITHVEVLVAREPSEFDLEKALNTSASSVQAQMVGDHASSDSMQRRSLAPFDSLASVGTEVHRFDSQRDLEVSHLDFSINSRRSGEDNGEYSSPGLGGDTSLGAVVNEREVLDALRYNGADDKDPTPPSTRQNSMADGAFSSGAMDESMIARAAVLAHNLEEQAGLSHQPTIEVSRDEPQISPKKSPFFRQSSSLYSEHQFEDSSRTAAAVVEDYDMSQPISLMPSSSRATQFGGDLTQTDHLNRTLLVSAASNIPSQFFEANQANAEDDEGPMSDDDEEDINPHMRAYLQQVKGSGVESDVGDLSASVAHSTEIPPPPSESDEAAGPPRLMRQFTATSDFEIGSSASPSPSRHAPDDGQVTDFKLNHQAPQSSPLAKNAVRLVETDAADAETDEEEFGFQQGSEDVSPNEDEDIEFQQAPAAKTANADDGDGFGEDDDFGDFEEANFTAATPVTAAPSQPAPVLAPPPQPAILQPIPVVAEAEPTFFASDADPDLATFLQVPPCGKCGAPLNPEMFSACVACGDTSKSLNSTGSSSRLGSRASSHVAGPGNQMILNDLLVAIDFETCVEDPSALPIAALAASDNDNALRLLLGEDVVDTKKSVPQSENFGKAPASLSSKQPLDSQKRKLDPEDDKSFFTV